MILNTTCCTMFLFIIYWSNTFRGPFLAICRELMVFLCVQLMCQLIW